MTGPDTAALAEELDAIRRRVLNVIGHELRTPATTVRGLAEQACLATDLEVVTTEIGPALLRGADRLMALLDQMLIATGVQTAIPVGAPEPVDVTALLIQRWSTLTGRPLAVDAPTAWVTVPPQALVSALDAVLANAEQYGSHDPSVTVEQSAGTTTIAVHSPGSPPHDEEVRLAAEPFFRGERAVTTRSGLGLGLAIAAAVVGHLGGELHFAADATGVVTSLVIPDGPSTDGAG